MSQVQLSKQEAVSNISVHGYLEHEAELIFHAAVHSGHLIRPQIRRFFDTVPGRPDQHLVNKLVANKHASVARIGCYDLIHIDSKTIYRCIGNPDSHNRKRKSSSLIRARLGALDYAIANRYANHLISEPEKVSFFTSVVGLSTDDLPRRIYKAKVGTSTTVHYFPDRFPITTGVNGSPIRFVFVDDPCAPFYQFKRYVDSQQSFWQKLSACTLVFVTSSKKRAELARVFCNDVLKIALTKASAEEITKFFLYRSLVDQGLAYEIPQSDLKFYKRALETFVGTEIEIQYRRFLAGENQLNWQSQVSSSIYFESFLETSDVSWLR